jgi:NitT/TauT family transport system permease protein
MPVRLPSPARPWVYRIASLAIVLGTWQLLAPRLDHVVSHPSAIARALYELAASGELWLYASESLSALALGMALALALGVPLGLAMARWRPIDWVLDSYVNAFYVTPVVALVPLIALWVGGQSQARVLVVLFCAVLPVLSHSYRGARALDERLLEVARSFRSSEAGVWRHLLLPWTLPHVAHGVRIAVARALVGLLIVEFYMAFSGLGYMIVRYAQDSRTDRTLVPVVLLMFVGITLTSALRWVEHRIAPWRRLEA